MVFQGCHHLGRKIFLTSRGFRHGSFHPSWKRSDWHKKRIHHVNHRWRARPSRILLVRLKRPSRSTAQLDWHQQDWKTLNRTFQNGRWFCKSCPSLRSRFLRREEQECICKFKWIPNLWGRFHGARPLPPTLPNDANSTRFRVCQRSESFPWR